MRVVRCQSGKGGGRIVLWQDCRCGMVVRWQVGKGRRVVRCQGGKGGRVVKWQGKRFLVLFEGGEHRGVQDFIFLFLMLIDETKE